MKKILLLSLLTIFSCISLYGVDSVSIKLKFTDDYGEKSNDLLFGIHKDATDLIDKALGEKELPFVPPAVLSSVLLITDSSNMEIFRTDVDFRPIPEEIQFYKYYKFLIENLETSYTISWSKIGSYVDSAFIRDIVNGKLANVNMLTQQSFYVENQGMDKFNIVVYYNKNFVDVNENTDNNVMGFVRIYPNPVETELKFMCDDDFAKYKLYNSSGFEIKKGEINGQINSFDMTSFSSGLYILSVENKKGQFIVNKFIKY